MNFKKHKNSIISGVSGLAVTIAIITLSNQPQIKSVAYIVNTEELRAQQLQLATKNSELETPNEKPLAMDISIDNEIDNEEIENIPANDEDMNTELTSQDDSNTAVYEDDSTNDTVSTKQWTRIGEPEILAAFHELNPMDSHLLTTVCETDSCQVEVAHADKVAEIQFISSMASSELIFGYEGHFNNIENEDGSTKSVFYFSRDPQQETSSPRESATGSATESTTVSTH